MPKTTKSAPKKRVAKKITIHFQKPAEEPQAMKLDKGISLAEFANEMSLDGYLISLNGDAVAVDTDVLLKDNDIIRIGLKTKAG